MAQEEKDLVIKDLCGRLPYSGVQIHISYADGFKYDKTLTYEDVKNYSQLPACSTTIVKPYLRPLSSMTDEEREEYSLFIAEINGCAYFIDPISQMDWLNKNMFDYRGLIPKGLALEATEWMCEHETKLEFNESGQRIGIGCKIRSKTNPDVILSIVSDDCHEDKFECSNGSVLSLEQIKKHYDLYIEENKGTIVIN